MLGSSLSRIQGYPQGERRRRERERERERERDKDRERERPDWGCTAESGKSLFFTVAFIF